MEVKVISLDDMLSPEQLAVVKAKRAKSPKRVDLSDLVPKKAPELEILECVEVVFKVQVNTCMTCGERVSWPLGLLAMHKIKRHGRHVSDLAGIALTAPNQHPTLVRRREESSSSSICCAKCVDEARLLPQPAPKPTPLPHWNVDGCKCDYCVQAKSQWLHRQEMFRRETEEPERAQLGSEIIKPISEFDDRDANEEPTSYDDTR